MMNLLFSAKGRINRSRLWFAVLLHVAGMLALCVALTVLWQVAPGQVDEDGQFSVSGVRAIPYVVLGLGYIVAAIWSHVCIGIKRYHDRGKSGAWVLIQFAPVIGGIWYFIEAGCLAGTPGPNLYGPDPLQGTTPAAVAA